MTPIQTLYTYLQTAGLLDTWTGPGGNTQPKPTVQMRLLEEERVPSDERILLIKSVSAGGGNRFVSDPVFVFAVIGKVGEPAVYAETYAELLYSALLEFGTNDCVVGIDPIGCVNGAYKMDSGRVAYDMEFSVTVDSGVLF
jgi:hypothetical protein